MDRRNLAYWTGLSGTWTATPPLAPSADDLQWFQRQVDRFHDRPLRALLLGVTPGLAELDWPAGTSLAALDWSEGMLRNVLPRAGARVPAAVADWRELPIAAASCDIAVGDGCYTAVGDMEGARFMTAELSRVLRSAGLICLRCFVRPERAPGVDALFDELAASERCHFDLFRWRLATAVQGDRWGVALREVWSAWDARVPDRAALAARHGWPAADLQRIERWKNEQARYAFPSLAELEELAAPRFELVEVSTPGYERAEYFPRIVLRSRA